MVYTLLKASGDYRFQEGTEYRRWKLGSDAAHGHRGGTPGLNVFFYIPDAFLI